MLVFASLSRESLRSSESAVHCGLTGQGTSKERYVGRRHIKKRKPLYSLTLTSRVKQFPNSDLQIPKTNKRLTKHFNVHEVATLFIMFQVCTLQT